MTDDLEAHMSDEYEMRFMDALQKLISIAARQRKVGPGSVIAMLLREVGAVAWAADPGDRPQGYALDRAIAMAEPNIRQGWDDAKTEHGKR